MENKNEIKLHSLVELRKLDRILGEVDEGLADPSRTIATSTISEELTSMLGMGVGVGTVAALTGVLMPASVLVGGTLTGLLAVAAAPVALVGGVGVGISTYVKNKKLRETKLIYYNKVIEKQNAIIKVLVQERDADNKRIEYLNSLNTLLQTALKQLKKDLGI